MPDLRIEGYVIVSADGMLANADRASSYIQAGRQCRIGHDAAVPNGVDEIIFADDALMGWDRPPHRRGASPAFSRDIVVRFRNGANARAYEPPCAT
jgi:hypothetical protein